MASAVCDFNKRLKKKWKRWRRVVSSKQYKIVTKYQTRYNIIISFLNKIWLTQFLSWVKSQKKIIFSVDYSVDVCGIHHTVNLYVFLLAAVQFNLYTKYFRSFASWFFMKYILCALCICFKAIWRCGAAYDIAWCLMVVYYFYCMVWLFQFFIELAMWILWDLLFIIFSCCSFDSNFCLLFNASRARYETYLESTLAVSFQQMQYELCVEIWEGFYANTACNGICLVLFSIFLLFANSSIKYSNNTFWRERQKKC